MCRQNYTFFNTTVMWMLYFWSSRYFLRNRFLCIYSVLLSVSLFVYFRQSKRIYPKEGRVSEELVSEITKVSCHISNEFDDADALPPLPSNASFPAKSIFFHDGSCTRGLTPRQACAVEAAARSHPGHQINVLFTSALSMDVIQESCIAILLAKYKNVKHARVHIRNYARGTPLAPTVNTLPDYRLDVYISKLIKYLTLYKYSGIYLGLDVVVARPLDDLWKNWVVRETNVELSANMFSFSENSVGRKLAEFAVGYLISEISLNKRYELWSYSEPSVMTHMLQIWCTTNKVQSMSLKNCDDLAVYGPPLFYPISFHNRAAYFKSINWDIWKKQKIYTYHIWEYFTKRNIVAEFSLYGKIVQEYCPTIFEKYTDQFSLYLDFF